LQDILEGVWRIRIRFHYQFLYHCLSAAT